MCQHKLLAFRAVIVGNVLLFLAWGIFALRLADLGCRSWLVASAVYATSAARRDFTRRLRLCRKGDSRSQDPRTVS